MISRTHGSVKKNKIKKGVLKDIVKKLRTEFSYENFYDILQRYDSLEKNVGKLEQHVNE